jgi:hypothetical protein
MVDKITGIHRYFSAKSAEKEPNIVEVTNFLERQKEIDAFEAAHEEEEHLLQFVGKLSTLFSR